MGNVLCIRTAIQILDQYKRIQMFRLSGIQMIFKTGPFGIRHYFDHSNIELAWYSDPQFIGKVKMWYSDYLGIHSALDTVGI